MCLPLEESCRYPLSSRARRTARVSRMQHIAYPKPSAHREGQVDLHGVAERAQSPVALIDCSRIECIGIEVGNVPSSVDFLMCTDGLQQDRFCIFEFNEFENNPQIEASTARP